MFTSNGYKLFIDHALFYENKLFYRRILRTTLSDSEAKFTNALSPNNPVAELRSSVNHLLSQTLAVKSTSVTAS